MPIAPSAPTVPSDTAISATPRAASASTPHPHAKIDVFSVHEEPFGKQADLFVQLATHQHEGAADPIHVPKAGRNAAAAAPHAREAEVLRRNGSERRKPLARRLQRSIAVDQLTPPDSELRRRLGAPQQRR